MLTRTDRDVGNISDDLRQELEVMREISTGICDTARSSVADWADIIGEEISSLHRIEELRSSVDEFNDKIYTNEKIEIDSSKHSISSDGDVSIIIEKLLKELPPSLKIEADEGRTYSHLRNKQSLFHGQLKDNGYVEFQGFWEPNKGFNKSIEEMAEDDDAQIVVGDAVNRVMILLVKDKMEKSVGMLMNDSERWGPGNYPDFVAATIRSAGRSSFPVKISKVESGSKSSKRIYFLVHLSSSEIHAPHSSRL